MFCININTALMITWSICCSKLGVLFMLQYTGNWFLYFEEAWLAVYLSQYYTSLILVILVVLSGVCFKLPPSMITWIADLRQFLNRQRLKWTWKSIIFGLIAPFSPLSHFRSMTFEMTFSLTHFFLCVLSSRLCVSYSSIIHPCTWVATGSSSAGQKYRFDWLSCVMWDHFNCCNLSVFLACCCKGSECWDGWNGLN